MSVKERSIRLYAHEVIAILDGRKTQARRAIDRLKGYPKIRHFGQPCPGVPHWHFRCNQGLWQDMLEPQVLECCPYGKPGDRLWVRETWCLKHDGDGFVYNKDGNRDSSCVWYRADGTEVVSVDGDGFSQWNQDGTAKSPWSPSIHMPRWASRITLEITDVRVERLNDISEEDAIAEGLFSENFTGWGDEPGLPHFPEPTVYRHSRNRDWTECAVAEYEDLWESINGEGSWVANPWVWVIDFKKLEAE